jgi:hypothetical protein
VPYPFAEVFLALLAVYMVYSVWAGLDARIPIAAALLLLVATAVVDALGNTDAANTLAEFVFFLLGAGVLLLLIDHVRESRTPLRAEGTELAVLAEGEASEATKERQGPSEKALHGLEK